MSSSPNSEKTPSWQPERETKTFEKFDMFFTMGVVTEIRHQWTRQLKNRKGEVLDPSDIEALKTKLEEDEKPQVEWIKTDALVRNSYVEWARFQDLEDCQKAKQVAIFSTADGPILGIVLDESETNVFLADPCVINYNQKSGSIQYLPIFNVARTLQLRKSAIRTRSAPAEIIIASYPGFILQNRMYQYQLRPTVAMESTPELDNVAEEAVTTETA
jgi:hypothetical protein